MNSSPAQPFSFEENYCRYLAGLLTNNRQQCRASFEQCLAATPELRSLYDDLVRRSLYEVGELWEQGKISVATEHLATAISEGLLNLTYPRLFARPRTGKSAVITCVANEFHQIGGRMVADIFELNGWRGHFLGANTPLSEVKKLLAEIRPAVVALSLATVMNSSRLVAAATEIRAAFPDLPILVGGQALRWMRREPVEDIPGVRCLADLGELEAWINQNRHHHV